MIPAESPLRAELQNSFAQFILPMVFMFGVVAITLKLLPLYFKSIGVSDSLVHFLFMIPPLVSILANQFWGYIADLHMNTKWAIIWMSIFSLIVVMLFPLVVSFPLLCVVMAIFTFFSNPRIPMINTLILSSNNGETRYGGIRTIGSAAFIVIGLLASIFSDRNPEQGLSLIFPMLLVCNLGVAITFLGIRDYDFKGRKSGPNTFFADFKAVQRKLLSRKIVRLFFAFIFLSQVFLVPSLISQSFYIKSAEFVGGTNTDVSIALDIGAAGEIVVFLLFGLIIRHIRLMPLMLLAFIFNPLRWMMVYLTTDIFWIWASNLFHSFSYGLLYMCAVIFVNRELPKELRNSAQTLLGLVFGGLAVIVGQLIASAFQYFFDVRSWFLLVAFLSFAPFPFWVRMALEYQREHKVSGFWVTNSVKEFKGKQ
ncbi:MAG: MFS transporter [Sumerlaeia bacterium]